MSSKHSDSRKIVLIVGGGFAGTKIARQLSATLPASSYNIVLVDGRPYHVALPATIRMVVSDVDNLEKAALIPYDKLFVNGNGRFVQGVVRSVNQEAGAKTGSVTLENGEELNYDVLVVATGSSWNGHLDFPLGKLDSFIGEQRARFSKAQRVVLIGGGAVGLETAGEIKDIWPEKEVTIVHSSPLPLNASYPDKFRRAAQKSFAARGIKLILDDIVENPPSSINERTTITTKKGVSLTADLIINTTGGRPRANILSNLKLSPLTSSGFVKIEPTLQVQDYSNIFAAGDIMDWKENKQAAKTAAHAAVVVKNVKVYLDGTGTFQEYNGAMDAILITNGKEHGVAYIPIVWGIVLGSFFTKSMKSRGLLLGMLKKELGY